MKKLIIGNWKLNPLTVREAQALAAKIDPKPKHTAVLCPPPLLLASVRYPRLGAQDCFWHAKGPYTGQCSPLTLKSLKVMFCIVGHSERRTLGESNTDINQKLEALLANGITPVLCVGYGTTVEEDDLEVTDILRDQITQGLGNLDPKQVVVAYEPVWAISSGNPYTTTKIASPEHAEKIAIYVKTKHHVSRVIYGGSSNAANAHGFLSQPNIDGLLVGGASLLPDDFNKILNLVIS